MHLSISNRQIITNLLESNQNNKQTNKQQQQQQQQCNSKSKNRTTTYIYFIWIAFIWRHCHSLLSSRLTAFMSHVILNMWLYPFFFFFLIALFFFFFNIHLVYWQRYLVCFMACASWKCCWIGARSVYTIQPRTKLQCHCNWSHTHTHARTHTHTYIYIYIYMIACVFSCNPLALLAEWPRSLTCYCGNTGMEQIPK